MKIRIHSFFSANKDKGIIYFNYLRQKRINDFQLTHYYSVIDFYKTNFSAKNAR